MLNFLTTNIFFIAITIIQCWLFLVLVALHRLFVPTHICGFFLVSFVLFGQRFVLRFMAYSLPHMCPGSSCSLLFLFGQRCVCEVFGCDLFSFRWQIMKLVYLVRGYVKISFASIFLSWLGGSLSLDRYSIFIIVLKLPASWHFVQTR